MAKIIIWDSNTTRATEYVTKFTGIANEILKVTTSQNDLQDCKLFFRHSNDNIDDIENNACYTNAIKIEFSGGGLNDEIIKSENPIEAKIASWEKIFRVLDILDKDNYTIDDVFYIIGFDPKLEALLTPFATLNPFNSKLPAAMDNNNREIKDKDGHTLNIKDLLTNYVKDKIAKQ